MPKHTGPEIKLVVTCFDCVHETSECYAVQGDSGVDNFCTHPAALGDGQARRSIPSRQTPEWCPLRTAALAKFSAALFGAHGRPGAR